MLNETLFVLGILMNTVISVCLEYFFCTGRVVGKQLCVIENLLTLLIYLMGFGHSFERSVPLNAPVIHLIQNIHLNSQG